MYAAIPCTYPEKNKLDSCSETNMSNFSFYEQNYKNNRLEIPMSPPVTTSQSSIYQDFVTFIIFLLIFFTLFGLFIGVCVKFIKKSNSSSPQSIFTIENGTFSDQSQTMVFHVLNYDEDGIVKV